MKTKKKYQGVVVPAVTPLTAGHRLDHEAVERIFARFRQYRVMPFILGTTGESASLPTAVKEDFIALAGELKQPGDMLYAGIASNALAESVELAQKCFDAGVDVVATHLPSYYALTPDQMLRYFEQLADQIPGPLVIYNIPATTHASIPLKIIDQLSHHPNIVGTKDSERCDERLEESLELWADRPDFSHFLGWAGRSADGLLAGSDGIIPSTGNLDPALYQELYQAARNGNKQHAHRLQKHSDLLGNLYQSGRTLGDSLWALKVLMQEAGLCQPYMMPPLHPMPVTEEETVRTQFYELIQKESILLNTPYAHA